MTYKCEICKKTFKGYGNSGIPLIEGKVCNKCNFEVIEERIRRMNLPKNGI
jgi:DNA-directed RNA polymerase subunit RPC12/RpoP